MIKFFVVRYVVSAIAAAEILILPIFLSGHAYAEVEIAKATVLLAQFWLLGAYTGYSILYYKEKIDKFESLLIGTALTGCAIFIIYGVYYKNIYFGFAAVVIAVGVVFEKRLQIQRKFILASVWRAFYSIFLILFTIFTVQKIIVLTPWVLVSMSAIIGIGLWLIIVARKDILEVISNYKFKNLSKNLNEYIQMIRSGFLVNASTAIIAIYLLYDRYVINERFDKYSAAYMLALNASQLILIGVNSFTFVLQIDIGESIDKLSKKYILDKLKLSIYLFISLFILSGVFWILYDSLFSTYEGFDKMYILVAVLLGGFFTILTVTSAAMYLGLNFQVFIIFCIALLLNIIGVWFLDYTLPTSYMLYIAKSGVILLLSAFIILFFILAKVRRAPS